MKNVLKGIEPERVLYYFEVMSNIVRGSSHEKPMSDYLVSFAKERGYEVWQDELFNIFMKVPGTCGGENAQPVVLHGHMDMVWNTAEGVKHDFFKEPLDLYIDERNFLRARGTTLGADNGIGVAYMLALTETKDIPHPPFQCVITVMEEMGKKGLNVFDTSRITAKRMIDFNWIDDKQILVGCSGDQSLRIALPTKREAAPKGWASIALNLRNLKGGHCEWDIHAERANSLIMMGRLLDTIGHFHYLRIVKVEGGVQNNVIPAFANAEILVPASEKDAVLKLVKEQTAIYQNEYAVADPDLTIDVSEAAYPATVLGEGTGKALTRILRLMPNGMLSLNLKVKNDKPFCDVVASCGGYPTETDNNLGILRTEEDEIWMITTITCAVTSRKHEVADKIAILVDMAGEGGTIEQFGVDAPEFPYNADSEMAKLAFQSYKEAYGFEPQLEVNCCSLQLGMLVMTCGLDCVGIGTLINGVHCAAEEMSLDSVKEVWKMILNFMNRLTKA